jgi:hypothetical protein
VPFSKFVFPDVLARFGLTRRPPADLFAGVPPVPPGDIWTASRDATSKLGALAHTEFSRSVWLVGPLLTDFWARYRGTISLIGGVEFAADPADELNGFVDFLVCRGPQTHVVTPPTLIIFEAKRDSIPDGLGQCIAGMVGVQRFNRRHGQPDGPVYGCVTTGSLWRFLRLDGLVLTEDEAEYPLAQADRLLGILTHIVGPPPA